MPPDDDRRSGLTISEQVAMKDSVLEMSTMLLGKGSMNGVLQQFKEADERLLNNIREVDGKLNDHKKRIHDRIDKVVIDVESIDRKVSKKLNIFIGALAVLTFIGTALANVIFGG